MSFLNSFIDWTHSSLLNDDEAQFYFNKRGVSLDQIITHKLGFINSDYDIDPSYDLNHDFTICSDFSLKNKWCDSCRFNSWFSSWDHGTRTGHRINNAIVIPITSYSSSFVGFQTRSISEKTYDTFHIKKRSEAYFFGTSCAIDHVWKSKSCYFVEGTFDHLVFERLFRRNVLSIMTSSFSESHFTFVKRFLKNVYICFDQDHAGYSGFKKILDRLPPDINVMSVSYPKLDKKGSDLNDFWKKVGDREFTSFFEKNYGELK
jgi:DNA primase